MNDNILNLEDGQLYLNLSILSIPLDSSYSSYIEALDALYSSLDYSLIILSQFHRPRGYSDISGHISRKGIPY